jgi:hypothetical protein
VSLNRFLAFVVGLLLPIGTVSMDTEVDCAASRGLLAHRWAGGTADEALNGERTLLTLKNFPL